MTSTMAAFYAGGRANSFLSHITFSPYLTFRGRFGYSLRSNLWMTGNKWAILGDGRRSRHKNSLLISYKYVRFYQTFLRRIRPYFFAGFGYHFDDHFDMDTMDDSSLLQRFTGYHYGTGSSENSLSSGISVNLLYDSRKNSEKFRSLNFTATWSIVSILYSWVVILCGIPYTRMCGVTYRSR